MVSNEGNFNILLKEVVKKNEKVEDSWCFKPSQPQRTLIRAENKLHSISAVILLTNSLHLIYPLTARFARAPQIDFAPSFLHFSLFSTALWHFANSRPVHSLMLSSLLFLCLHCLHSPFTVPCKMVLARPDSWETCPYHFSLRLFTMVRRSSCGPIARWILARTS